MIPGFVVASLDGKVITYTDAGQPLDLPAEVVTAWRASGAVQVIEMRAEPSQVENVVAQNQMEAERRRGCQCDSSGWLTARLRGAMEMRFHRSECPVSVAYQRAREAQGGEASP